MLLYDMFEICCGDCTVTGTGLNWKLSSYWPNKVLETVFIVTVVFSLSLFSWSPLPSMLRFLFLSSSLSFFSFLLIPLFSLLSNTSCLPSSDTALHWNL
ncbi:hypothetical protein B9Z19DRAFT_1074299 [Tuber borchii]|uniref:Uncharacterized protein n=1 Tax=Tuber borchii TaxID=42251 RepID=A0A2T7A4N1_TUBBO|nr:hypothetical protein B9Z19DRAFT_1074299 [Tuber borchii]